MRSDRLYLADTLDAIQAIERFTANCDDQHIAALGAAMTALVPMKECGWRRAYGTGYRDTSFPRAKCSSIERRAGW